MKIDNEFKNYIENTANNYNYKITQDEIDNLHKEFFGEDGIVKSILDSRIKDLIHEKNINKSNIDLER